MSYSFTFALSKSIVIVPVKELVSFSFGCLDFKYSNTGIETIFLIPSSSVSKRTAFLYKITPFSLSSSENT